MRLTSKKALRVCRPQKLLLLMASVGFSGCMRAPSFNVLGSYFPGWIECILAGIAIPAIVRWILNRTGMEGHLPLLPILYLSLALLIACGLWLIAFE